MLLAVCCFACTPAMGNFKVFMEAHLGETSRKIWNVVLYALVPVALLLLSTANLVGDSYNPFLYFQF